MENKIAKQNSEIWTELDGYHHDRVTDSDRYYKIMFSNPYTEDQKNEIENQNLDSKIYVGLIGHIVKSLVGQAYSGKNSLTAIGDPKSSFLWQVVITGALQKMAWLNTYRKLQFDKHVLGIGIAMIDKDDSETNPYGTKILSLDPRKCRWSMNANDPLWSDLDLFAYCTTMSVKQAIIRSGKEYSEDMFQEYYEEIVGFPDDMKNSRSLSDMYNWKGERRVNRPVPWIETYQKEYGKYLQLIRYNEDKSVILSKHDIRLESENVDDCMMDYFVQRNVKKDDALEYISECKQYGDLKELKLERVVKHVSVGGMDIGKYDLPGDQFPFVPFWYDMLDGKPFGVVQEIEGTANAANNTMLMMLISGWKSCGTTILDYGDNKTEELAQKLSGINNVVPIRIKELSNGGAIEPKVLQFEPLSDAFNRLLMGLIDIARLGANVNESMQGIYPGNTPPAGSAVSQLQEAGSRTFKPYVDQDQMAMAQLGRALVHWIKRYSKTDQVIRIMTNDEMMIENIKSSGLIADTTEMPGYNVQMPINKEVNIDGKTIIINQLNNSEPDVDFVVVSEYYHESQKRAWLDMMMNTMQQAPQTYTDLIGYALKIMEYPQAIAVSKRLDNKAQLEAQVESLNNEIKNKDKQLKLFMEQNFRSKVSSEVSKVKSDLETMLANMRADAEIAKNDPSKADEVAANIQSIIDSIETMNSDQPVQEFINQNTPTM